jgi:hypothetical protein
MSVSIRKARDYVFSSGTLWERALFSYLFDDGPLAHVHQCLLCYKNPDDGWGNGLEHDLKVPDSHPAALEYLLGVLRDFEIPAGDLLDGTPEWVERQQNADGSLVNPPTLNDYPIAPWWAEWGGQTAPDSIVGNLTRMGLATPTLADLTRRWVLANHSLDKIRANEWLFMNYHAYDYFMHVSDFPDIEQYRLAVIENIVACATKIPEAQYHSFFSFAPTPDSPAARALPAGLLNKMLDYLQSTQRDDGGWSDQHNMPSWQPSVTMSVLMVLQRYGRI